MDNIICETDLVKEYIGVMRNPLAELRQKDLAEIRDIMDHMSMDGIAIGISPSDVTLNKYDRGEITKLVTRIFKRTRLSSGQGLELCLAAEYSPQHRWHYHGVLKVPNIKIVDNIKKRLNQYIGRTVTEQIKHTEEYKQYMFKQYIADENNYYMWNKEECYINVVRT